MISMKIQARKDQTEIACLMKGTGKDIEREIIHAPAGLIRQFIECLQQNEVPDDIIRAVVRQLILAMTDELKEQLNIMVEGGVL